VNRCSNMPLLYLGRPRGRTSRAMTADSWNEATSGTLYHLSPVWMCLSWCHLSGVALTPVLSPFLATNAGEAGLLRHSSSAVCSRVIRVSFTAASSRSARTWGALVPNFQTTAAVRGRRRQALARAMRQDTGRPAPAQMKLVSWPPLASSRDTRPCLRVRLAPTPSPATSRV